MMRHVEFFGPICIYVKKSGHEWQAWVDPFSVAGTGSSKTAAMHSAYKNLKALIDVLSKEVSGGSASLEILRPLDEDKKRGQAWSFLVYCMKPGRARKRTSVPCKPQKITNRALKMVLKYSEDVRLVSLGRV
jgi:hypothetical protein